MSGLDRDATAALVRRIVAVEPSQEYLAEVHRRSGGNPFFATEVARLQAEPRHADRGGSGGVRQVLEHRLARLPQESVELLQVASVVGAPHVGRLAAVTGLAEAEVAALLDEPAAAGVVVAGAFAHDLMRETLYLGMSPNRRATLHRQVAEHLQAEGPAELARHWSLASGEDARRRAAQLALVAGDLAAAGLAHEQAVGHYRMALELGAGDLDVRRRLGEAQVLAGQIGAGRDTLRPVARKARDAGAAEELARAVLAMGGGVGGFEVDIFDVEQAPLLEDALRLLPDQDSALRAAVLARLSVASAAIASADERAGLAEEAAAMARRVGDPEAEVAALAAFCDARSGPDFVEERIDAAGRMLALADGHALLELLARRIRLRARLELGDLIGVDADIAGYARIADRLRSPTYGWLVPMWRGMRAVLDGDLDAASRYADEVATLAETAQSTNAVMMAWTLRWRVARLRQDAGTIGELPAAHGGSGRRTSRVGVHLRAAVRRVGRPRARATTPAPGDGRRSGLHSVRLGVGRAAVVRWARRRCCSTSAKPCAQSTTPWSRTRTSGRWTATAAPASARSPTCSPVSRTTWAARPPVPPGRAAFVRTGTVWRLEFRGRAVTVVDSKGMRDLAVLLARPGREVHVLDLVEASGGPSRAEAGTDTGPMIDAAARARTAADSSTWRTRSRRPPATPISADSRSSKRRKSSSLPSWRRPSVWAVGPG